MARRKKTNEEFLSEVEEDVGNEYIFLEEYTGANDKLLCWHRECKKEFSVTPAHFLHDESRCPNCSYKNLHKKFKKTTEDFLSEVRELTGEEYIFYGEYYNARTKMRVKHKCGNKYEITPDGFLSGSRCIVCHNKKISEKYTKTNEEFLEEVGEQVGEEYTFLEPYKKSNNHIWVLHNECGHEYKVTPNSFLSGSRCGVCAQENLISKLRRTQEEFVDEVRGLVGEEYVVLGEYVNSNTKVPMRHEVCGKDFDMRPSQFLNRGTRCPHCSESKGEKEIGKTLVEKEVRYESQYKIAECRNVRPLPFDFAILNEDKELIGLIEYDGEQHFKPVKFFGGVTSYLGTRRNDTIKNDYCLRNNIPLLRIPYWEFGNISNHMEVFLGKVHKDVGVSAL